MLGKIHFELNEKLYEGKTFEIVVDYVSIGKVSQNNKSMDYNASKLKKYNVFIKSDSIEKNVVVDLNDQSPERTIEIITDKENNKYYWYLTFVIAYIAVIILCYFILDIDIYYVLILMALALPLVISKLLNNNNSDGFKLKVI